MNTEVLPNDPELAKEQKENPEKGSAYQKWLEDYLREQGEWKFNILNGCSYIKEFGSSTWLAFDKRLNNSIRRELRVNFGRNYSQKFLDETINSDFAEPFNPIQQYFEDLEPWNPDGKSYIKEYAKLLKKSQFKADVFLKYFTKWLVGAVANVLKDGSQNELCLTIVGKQGEGKSTFLDGLYPKNLFQYCFTGKINFEKNFDINTQLAQNFIIHIEETLGDLMIKSKNDVKELITRPRCLYIPKYANEQKPYARIASICASLNDKDFLTDDTGDRRFFVVDAKEIDHHAIRQFDIDKLWAEAYYLYKTKYAYFCTDAERRAIIANNKAFKYRSEEMEWLLSNFDFHLDQEDARTVAKNRFTASDLAAIMRENRKNHKTSPNRISKALRQLGLEYKQDKLTGSRFYYISFKQDHAASEFINTYPK